jgi:uncharacterized protein
LPDFVTGTDDGAVVEVFVQPRAAKDAIVGLHGAAVKIKIKAPPLDDRANRSVSDFVAALLGVPRSSVAVIGGRASRHKRIKVTGTPPEEVARAFSHVLSSRAHESG